MQIPIETRNHYGQYSKKQLVKLILELYNDNVTMRGQLKWAEKQLDLAVAKNIELELLLSSNKCDDSF